MTVEIVEAATLGPGIAPVKREFLVVAAQVSSAQEPVVNDGSSAKRSAPDGADLQEDEGQGEKAQRTNGNNKNRKGMTKNRPKSVSRDSMELCRALLRGDPCLGGQECPSAGRTQVTHDIQAFLDAKGPDIGDSCPIFQSLGICRFGLGCRFAKSHTEPSTFTQIRDTAKIASESTAKEGTLNAVSMDLIKNVRSRKVDLPRSKAWATTSAAKKGPSIPEASATSSEAVKETEATTTNVEVSKDVVTDSPGNAYARHIGLDTDKDPDTRKKIDFRGKTYLAPLTTVGNLPFRRICKQFGVDVTCGEMVLANPLLQGQRQDWALLRRHPSEDLFGVQIAGGQAQAIGQTVEILSEHTTVDFIDLNLGCPIDLVTSKGAGSALLERKSRLESILSAMKATSSVPFTVKIRTGVTMARKTAHTLLPLFQSYGASLVTLHGRSKEQRYAKRADWEYISECAKLADPMPLFGNGDVLGWEDYYSSLDKGVSGVMIGRGALIKPWLFKEIKERKVYDISATERLDIMKEFTRCGLEYWGSDTMGVNTTRRFLCEWLSFACRYIPAGLLEVLPQRMNERPPAYRGRNELETLMASDNADDWVKLSELVLGPAPDSFKFLPKHKSNSYEAQG